MYVCVCAIIYTATDIFHPSLCRVIWLLGPEQNYTCNIITLIINAMKEIKKSRKILQRHFETLIYTEEFYEAILFIKYLTMV